MTQPYHRPEAAEKSPKPRFHARKVWKQMWEAWREIVSAFWEASVRLLAGAQ